MVPVAELKAKQLSGGVMAFAVWLGFRASRTVVIVASVSSVVTMKNTSCLDISLA